MNCLEAKELIQLYMDNELDPRNTLGVQHHLETCPSCQSLLNYFIKQDQSLQTFAKSQRQDNGNLREAILQAIHQEPVSPPAEAEAARTSFLKSWLQSPSFRRVAAILVVIMTIAFFLLRGGINEKVYADGILDHEHHCTLDRLSKAKAVSDPAQIDKLCAEYGRLDKVPDLSAFGFSNVRAKICPLDNIKFLHLIYQSDSQKPLSIFFRLHDKELIGDDLLMLKKQGYEIASLSKAGIDWVVISMLDEQQTAAITKHLSENL
jgi:hypothetical protein